jgi:VTC domain
MIWQYLMSTIATTNNWQQFQAISLDDLNYGSAMLTRLDNKYLVHHQVLQAALQDFAKHFDILEINKNRLFTYESCYFDDANLRCYFDHHQGRRQRIKIRTRKYVESDLCFVEIKLKNSRGITIKKRLAYPVNQFGELNSTALAYIDEQHFELYGRGFSNVLQPTLRMSYERATLVAKQGGERVTIDRQIRFNHESQTYATNDDIVVIETKSKNGNGIADALLRKLHQHPSNKCSKYCVGMCITQQVNRFNNFMPTLRKLGALPARAPHITHTSARLT